MVCTAHISLHWVSTCQLPVLILSNVSVLLPLMIALLCKVNMMIEQGSVCIDAIFSLATVLFVVGFTTFLHRKNCAVKEHKYHFLISWSVTQSGSKVWLLGESMWVWRLSAVCSCHALPPSSPLLAVGSREGKDCSVLHLLQWMSRACKAQQQEL